MNTRDDKQDNREPSGLGSLDGHLDDWAELAIDYLDGSLPSDTRLAVEEHLKRCPSCSARLGTQREIADMLEAVDYVDPPSSLSDKIREALLYPVKPLPMPGREPKPHSLSWSRRLRPWIPVTVCVAAVLIGVVTFGVIRNRPGYFSVSQSVTTTTTTHGAVADKGVASAPSASTAFGSVSTAGASATTTAASARTTVASTSSVPLTGASTPATSAPIQDKATLINTLKSTNGPYYLALGGAAGAGPVYNNSVPSTTSTSSDGAQSDQAAAGQMADKAALITNMTTLEPLPSELWLGGPTFAAFLRQKDAAPLIDLLNSMGMSVTLESTAPADKADIVAQILASRPGLPMLSAQAVPQPEVSGNTFTTSPLPPADQSGGTPTTLPDEGGAYVLVILVVTL